MSDTALQNLQTAVKTAAGTDPIVLDSAFLTAGLDDASVVVPASYDDDVKSAYQLAEAADLKITADVGNVGPVTDGTFKVTDATIPFIGIAVKTPATLLFTTTKDGDTTSLVVQIETTPAGWTWDTSFPFMTGFPFDQLDVLTGAKFAFSTASGRYPWGDDNGLEVTGGPNQSFIAAVPFPEVVEPFLELFVGLQAPGGSLQLAGSLNLALYNAETVLYPVGTLDASIQKGTFKLFGVDDFALNVADPRVRLTIPAPDSGGDNGDNGNGGVAAEPAEDADTDQAVSLSIATNLAIGDDVDYQIEVLVARQLWTGQVEGSNDDSSSPTSFDVALTATDDKSLTPAKIVELAGGRGGYLGATPPVLQQFLAFVGLQGLSFSGQIDKSVTLSSLAVRIGSSEGTEWTPIPNPPKGFDFTIKSFSLDWSVHNPLDSRTRQQNFVFSTEFTLMTSVFKGSTPGTDGVFAVEFSSGLQLYASFDGTAKLSDFVGTLTDNAVRLESVLDVELSNIKLAVDFNTKAFAFSSDFGVELPFLQIDDHDIIRITDGTVSISAKTATSGSTSTDLVPLADTAAATVWQGSVSGLMAVGPVAANVDLSYDGSKDPAIWDLKASLASPVSIRRLIDQFFDPTGSYEFPTFLVPNVTIKTFVIAASIPAGKDGTSSYSIDTTFMWQFQLGPDGSSTPVGIDPARIKIDYDGAKDTGKQLSGLAEGTFVWDAIGLRLLVGYEFTPEGSNSVLYLEWEGFRASYATNDEVVTFMLKGWTLGSLIQALVRTLGDPYFTLTSPWDLLDKIPLDGLSVELNLKQDADPRITAKYTLSSPIDLGFMEVNGVVFGRDESAGGKVTIALDLTVAIPGLLLDNVSPEDRKKFENLTNTGTGGGQDVNNLPTVPGRGQQKFKLFLLVVGQKVAITGHASFKDTKAVIEALQKVPGTEGDENPVNPNADKAEPPPDAGVPYYSQQNNWLFAGHLGLLKVGDTWTVEIMIVFNDPDLYGLRLALGGEKAGPLAGLVIDIIYKRITDDIGMYQIDFVFPDSIRNLDFGTVSVVLPDIGIQIYTNGDFLIDIGFPYNNDFSRSFSISAIIYGVPVMGSGGIYFGKLSNATSTFTPETTKGTFDPVIVIGVGLQLGLGYNFQKGPLSAGFALTAFGIIEGVFASWHPYDSSSTGTDLESQAYYKVSGTVGLIGLLYGKIDFKIITASLEVKLTLSVSATIEPYRKIPLSATVSVSVSLKVKINLGIFSITISLSFSTSITVRFEIGNQGQAPWDDGQNEVTTAFYARNNALLSGGPDEIYRRAREIQPVAKRVVGAVNASPPTLKLLAAPQFTVAAPQGATDPALQQGAFVMLFAIDAPDPTGHGADPTSFDILCSTFFPWLVDTMKNEDGDVVDLDAVATTTVTRTELATWVCKLGDTDDPPVTFTELLQFLADSFIIDIETPAKVAATPDDAKKAEETPRTLFPLFDGLSLTVPDAGGSGTKPITLASYTTATSAYRTAVADRFAEVEASLETENQEAPTDAFRAVEDDAESMAALIYTDVFAMIGRQLLQAAEDALAEYAYAVQPTDSIDGIITKLGAGNGLSTDDVAVPNAHHNLAPSIPITIDGLVHTIQTGETLTSVAAAYTDPAGQDKRWTTTPAQLVAANGMARSLAEGITLQLTNSEGATVPYTTIPGETFDHMAKQLGIDLAKLSTETELYDAKGLLSPAKTLGIAAITYTTAGAVSQSEQYSSDTLEIVAALFATTVPALGDANAGVKGLFSPAAEKGILTIANLIELPVGELWDAVAKTEQVAQTAGMVGRFLMFGLRLPKLDGLTLSDQFLYPTTAPPPAETSFGLYQLTGQQFPTPASATTYDVGISRADSVNGVDLSFIRFDGTTDTSASLDLTKAHGALEIVANWARTPGNFAPTPSYESLGESARQPKSFSVTSSAGWSTSDLARLDALTDRGSAPSSNGGSQRQPILWAVPDALMSGVETRQARIETAVGTIAKTVPLLPQFQPRRGVTSTSTGRTSYSDLENWAWATRVDFQVKRLPATTVTPDPSDTSPPPPTGAAAAPSLNNVYEVIGPTSQAAQRLERLLSAMDELGEDMASGVFLLYDRDGSNASGGLVAPADSEFLSFLTQTNLSTETNPERSQVLARAEADTSPRGVANSPGEFVKLLWELSVVRSGGYYLYYEVAETGDGLPATLFDTTGTATLSMVVTQQAQGPSSQGEAVFDFTNAFVTTDNIDTAADLIQLQSQSATGSTAPLTGDDSETLAGLSMTYGPGVGRIAETNSTTTLTAGTTITVAGVVRQLTEADLVDPAQTLANLASHYSKGAAQPITAADIEALNPNVSVELGAVFYIPKVDYVIAPSSPTDPGPGDTFADMSAWYGASVDVLAVAAASVGGLFPASTVLTIDSEMFELKSAGGGPANVTIQLQRENPGLPELPENPTTKQRDAYAKATMYSLYNTLSAGFAENAYFDGSGWGVPFGPQHDTSEAEPNATHAQRMELRRQSLQAAANEPFVYTQTLGLGTFPKVNPAPPAGPGLPDPASNPYIGVGSTAQVALRWQDSFGNTTVTPFVAPPAGYSGAISGSAARIQYGDRLIGLGAWPGVLVNYVYGGSSGSPELEISFALDTTSFEPGSDATKQALKQFTRIYFQLHQDYDAVSVPDITGNAVTMALTNSLLTEPDVALSSDDQATIRAFVADCYTSLEKLAGGTTSGGPSASIKVPVELTDIQPDENVIALDVGLTLHRNPLLVAPEVAGLADGIAVSSPILPNPDSDDDGLQYTQFAAGLEKVLATDDWHMKVGEGLAKVGDRDDKRSQQLWVVRIGDSAGKGVYFEIGDDASYYAPTPIAKALESATVPIEDFSTGETTQVTFTGADQNLWFQTVLDSIDTFLSAEYSSGAFILDKLLGTDDPLDDGYLGKVLTAKQGLADDISTTVTPVLSTSSGDASSIAAAAEKLRQQLLNKIGVAYAAGAAVVYDLTDVSGGPAHAPQGPPALYGQPTGKVDGKALNQNYTLASAKVPLGQVPSSDGAAFHDPRLAFAFTTKNIATQAYVPLDDLSYSISHLEFDRQSVPGIQDYVQSRWIAFVNGPFVHELGRGTANIPVINRSLPTPPTVQKQTAAKPSDTPTTPIDLVAWDFSFEYLYQQAAQDSVQNTIKLNYVAGASGVHGTPAEALFAALAQFVSSYPAIEAAFAEYLPKLDAAKVDDATKKAAEKAVSTYEALVTTVQQRYHEMLGAVAHEALVAMPAVIEVTYETSIPLPDGGEDQPAILNLIGVQIDGQPATWDAHAKTITAPAGSGTITLPAPVVDIDPDAYDCEPVDPPQVNATISYTFTTKGPDPTPLSYKDALANPVRVVRLDGLDALAHQSGWASVYVERNKILVPEADIDTVTTNEAFVFQTPVVKFADSVIPRLVHQDFALSKESANGDAVRAALDQFFEAMFAGGTGRTSVEVLIDSGYSYLLLPDQQGVPRTLLPISMQPAIETPVDPATPPAFTTPFAASIAAWQTAIEPTTDGDPQLNFGLKLFGGISDKQPLLDLANLYYGVDGD